MIFAHMSLSFEYYSFEGIFDDLISLPFARLVVVMKSDTEICDINFISIINI